MATVDDTVPSSQPADDDIGKSGDFDALDGLPWSFTITRLARSGLVWTFPLGKLTPASQLSTSANWALTVGQGLESKADCSSALQKCFWIMRGSVSCMPACSQVHRDLR